MSKILTMDELRKRIVHLMDGFMLLGALKQVSEKEVLVTIVESDYKDYRGGHPFHVDQRLSFTTGLRFLRMLNPGIKITMVWLSEDPREIQPMEDVLRNTTY